MHAWPHTPKNDSINLKKPSTLISRQNINFLLHVFFDILQRYCKPVVLCALGMSGYAQPNWHYHLVENFCLSAGKKSTSSPLLLWKYCKDMQTYFGYFGHAWLHSPKMIVSTCRRLRCVSTCKNYTWSLTSFLRYYNLKNPAIWLAKSFSAHNSRSRILPDMVVKYQKQF